MPTRHVKKEREKMHTQRRYATCPQGMSKEEEEEKDSPHPRKKKKEKGGERGIMQMSSSTIYQTKKKYPHTCTS